MSQQFLKHIQRGQTAEATEAIAADPSLISWRDAQGVSALMWATYHGQTAIRELLLAEMARTGAPLDLYEAAAVGDAAQLASAIHASPELVQSWSTDGWTPLHLAAAFGTPEAVELLLVHDADVSAVSKNPQKNQPLHAALALGRNPESIRLLLEAGADPNALQTAGFTAIFSAAAANRRDLCELLIAHGADPAIQNDFGQTAATFATERSHQALADWLNQASHSSPTPHVPTQSNPQD